MFVKSFLLSFFGCFFLLSSAQVGLVDECAYFFTFKPMLGSLNTTTDITQGVNKQYDVQSKGFYYGADLLNASWTYVEGAYLVPQIQVPLRIRYIQTDDLHFSDGTAMPVAANPAFYHLNLGLQLQYSPIYFRLGNVLFTPKVGIGFDLAKHNYNHNLAAFVGKEGTSADLQAKINAIAPESPVYRVSFWEDVYGFNLGAYINLGTRFIVEGGWEYYPLRFIIKKTGLSMYDDFGKEGYMDSSPAFLAKLNRWNVELRWNILTNVAAFAKYESSYYKYGIEGGIEDEGIRLLDKEIFTQVNNAIVFGVAIVFAQ
ncbi:MAG: hypothetical protein JXQ69_02475 [Paludibacteraceae bacterium]|nr:hypothetical protein [Paludibacteraceae bacterium]MBN2787166.1 hypothetical protein [Paludibacteraceae bacterium]